MRKPLGKGQAFLEAKIKGIKDNNCVILEDLHTSLSFITNLLQPYLYSQWAQNPNTPSGCHHLLFRPL